MTQEFRQGLGLSEDFFHQVVEPIVARSMPRLRYGAALIGDGSDVLGYDTPISSDHDWGPRVLLFLDPADFETGAKPLLNALDHELPALFGGWPVRFPDQDRPAGCDPAVGAGSWHGVELHTLDGWTSRQLGSRVDAAGPATEQWEAFAEDRLLSVVAGAVFRDDGGRLGALRRRLAFWPPPLRLRKMAALWSDAAAEMPFVGRAGDCGDDVGSRLLAARLVARAVRLTFLVDGQYAPYSKWLGTAWSSLPTASRMRRPVEQALAASDWRAREREIACAFLVLAEAQHQRRLGDFIPRIGRYFDRPYTVINADEIAAATLAAAQRLERGDTGE